MSVIHPSVQRYQKLKSQIQRLPTDREGGVMVSQPMKVDGEEAHISRGSAVDNDPKTDDFITLSINRAKGNHTEETFLELPEQRTYWGNKLIEPQRLVHVTRDVAYQGGVYGPVNMALKTIDLSTGEMTSDLKGDAAFKAVQQVKNQSSHRLHNIEKPKQPENLLDPRLYDDSAQNLLSDSGPTELDAPNWLLTDRA